MAANITIETTPARPVVSLKRILLPAEHGAWGMLAEPIVAGLAIAFSPSAPWIALFVAAAFMARQPMKVLFAGIKAKSRWADHHRTALQYILIFGGVALVGDRERTTTVIQSREYVVYL